MILKTKVNMPVATIAPGWTESMVRQSDALREIAARDARIAELEYRLHPKPEHEALEICDSICVFSGSYELEIWRRCEKAHGIGD